MYAKVVGIIFYLSKIGKVFKLNSNLKCINFLQPKKPVSVSKIYISQKVILLFNNISKYSLTTIFMGKLFLILKFYLIISLNNITCLK